jgi:CRISPR type III-B/RAMP module-associated protein Cmr5
MPLEKDHLRARAAHKLVESVAGLSLQGDESVMVGPVEVPRGKDGNLNQTRERFNSHIHGLPVLIHRSGLLQAMAFYRAKTRARKLIYFSLLNWLRHSRTSQGMPDLAAEDFSSCEDYFDRLIGQPSEQIRVLTSEAQAFLVWLKQFSEARFGEPDANPDDD